MCTACKHGDKPGKSKKKLTKCMLSFLTHFYQSSVELLRMCLDGSCQPRRISLLLQPTNRRLHIYIQMLHTPSVILYFWSEVI